MSTPLALDRVTSLAMDPGARVVVHGLVTTSVDGSTFDAAMQWDGLSPGATRPEGLFDLAAGGLRVVEQHPERHEYVLASTGAPGTACATARATSPCLVPRLAALAHERLKTQAELAPTLRGGMELDGVIAPPIVPASVAAPLEAAGVVAALALAVVLALVWLRRRAQTALGRVRTAAREALHATQGDTSLRRVGAEVRAMLARARELDATRRACARRLATIDRAALERKRDVYARSTAPGSAETLRWVTEEQAEADRLAGDLSSSMLGLQRIESALRVVTLRVREERGTRVRIGLRDPVDVATSELDLRDEARREADRVVGL